MLKKKIKKYTSTPIWKVLSKIKVMLIEKKNALLLGLANNDNKLLNSIVKNKYKKIIYLDSVKPIEVFKESGKINIYKPNYEVAESPVAVNQPVIGLYFFNNAKVCAVSSHVILTDSIIMERLPHVPVEQCNYATGFIKAHDIRNAILDSTTKCNSLIEVESAFFLGGNGAWNYYHWSIEILPKLKYFLSCKLIPKDLKIVVPDYAKNIKSFAVLMEVMLNNKYEFIYISREQVASIKNLYVITTPSNVVFNSVKGVGVKEDFTYIDKISIDYVRKKTINSQQYFNFTKNNKNKIDNKKIFLARKEMSARSYNQDEVIKTVVKYGFLPVFLEELSFFEQVYLFQNVDYLIGASGAAWTNLIYIKPGAKGLSWLSESASGFSGYSTLAEYYNCELNFFKYKEDDKDNAHSNYYINIEKFENELVNLLR